MADIEAKTDEKFQTVCDEIPREMERLKIPGVAFGIWDQGQERTAGFGVTSVENPLPVDAGTLFQIGSISKTFLATTAMRLVEMGKLSLDEPVRAYLPGLRMAGEGVAERVTLRHLLTHTGGWLGDYFNDFGSGEDALATMVAKIAGLPQITPLGKYYSYNNAGFYLAGRAIEVVYGKPYETAVKELVIDPLGLEKTFFFPGEVMTYRFVVGHQVFDGQAKVARPWPVGRSIHPAGGVISTVKDLLCYARFHMGNGMAPDGNCLLSPESLSQMQTPQCEATGLSKMGITWFITPTDRGAVIGHGGATKGQETTLRMVPERDFAVTILTNCDQGGTLTDEIYKLALKVYSGITFPQAVPLPMSEAETSPYLGNYDSYADTADLTWKDSELWMQVVEKGGFPTPDTPAGPNPPPVRMAFYDADKAILLDEPYKDSRVEFQRNPEGKVEWMRLSGRIHMKERKMPI
jgi:CubicO group peptidase (beta-lactamase class C family)